MPWMETLSREGLDPRGLLAERHRSMAAPKGSLNLFHRSLKHFPLGGRQPGLPSGRTSTLEALHPPGSPISEPDMGGLAGHSQALGHIARRPPEAEQLRRREAPSLQCPMIAVTRHAKTARSSLLGPVPPYSRRFDPERPDTHGGRVIQRMAAHTRNSVHRLRI
jgi:hypothetical protein